MTKQEEYHRCEGTVFRDWHRQPCSKPGKYFEDGKWYCHVHSPKLKAERDAKRRASYDKQWAERDKGIRRTKELKEKGKAFERFYNENPDLQENMDKCLREVTSD